MQRSAWTVSWRALAPGILLAALGVGGCAGADAPAPAPATESEAVAAPEGNAVLGAHEIVPDPGETFTDERGLTVEGMGIDFAARRYPASADFPTGPALGERLPEFILPNQHGEPVDFHADRGGQGAVVVFYRSAVW